MEVIKQILKNYPKPLIFLLSVIGMIVAHFISQVLNNQHLYFGKNFWILIIVIGMLLIAGFISACIKTISLLNQTKNQPQPFDYYAQNKRRKTLPDLIKIFEEINGNFKWEIKIKRWFLPTDKPGIEQIEEALFISSMLCSSCGLEIEGKSVHPINSKSITFFKCLNPNCATYGKYPPIREEAAYQFTQAVIMKVKSEIRTNFEKIWNLYVKEYDRLTNKKYDEYDPP